MTDGAMFDRLGEARERFHEEPNPTTAHDFAVLLIENHARQMIGNDTFREGLIKIADDLTGATNDLGYSVETVTRPI